MNPFVSLYELFLAKRCPVRYVRRLGVHFGDNCRFIGIDRRTFGSEPYLVKLGDNVTVTSDVRFITHDGGVWVFRNEEPGIDLIEPITVGNNVFIGLGTILLPGAIVGDNVVIGAGSVVSRKVPGDSVVAGVPARVISSLSAYRDRVGPRLENLKQLSHSDKAAFLAAKFPFD